MAYTVEDITKLIRYHLVRSEDTDEEADANLRTLLRDGEQMLTPLLGDQTSQAVV